VGDVAEREREIPKQGANEGRKTLFPRL